MGADETSDAQSKNAAKKLAAKAEKAAKVCFIQCSILNCFANFLL